MNVARNIGFGLRVRKQPKDVIDAKVAELIELVRLDGKAKSYPAQLSGGERQRMALARALAIEPRVLLLDEPFGALDALVRTELRQWVKELHRQIKVTTILVTHDQDEAMEVADQLLIMHEGRIEQAGEPTELYERRRLISSTASSDQRRCSRACRCDPTTSNSFPRPRARSRDGPVHHGTRIRSAGHRRTE